VSQPPTSGTEPRVQVLTAPDGDVAARSWDALPSTTAAVGGSAWVRAWLEVYGADSRPLAAVVGPADRPRAVLPLVRRRNRPWTAEVLGVRQLAEPTDVRAADDASLRALVQAVAATRLPLRLKRLPADSPLLPHLREVYGRSALLLSRRVIGTPTISLDDSWLEPETHFSSRRRSDARAARRRADRLGEVELSVLEPAPGEVGPLFDEVVAVEGAGWKVAAGTALASQPQMRAFFRRFCELAAEQGALRLAFLRIDGRPVAVQVAVEQDGRYSLFKIGFDEEFARCSPGNLLMLHAVRWAAERGLTSFEFLGIEEPWTALWTEQVRGCVEVQVYPLSGWSVPAAAEVGWEVATRAVRAGARAAARRVRTTGSDT